MGLVNGTQRVMFRSRFTSLAAILVLVLISAWSIVSSADELRRLAMEIKIKETELARKERDYDAYEENTKKLSQLMRDLAEMKQKITPYPSALYRQLIELDEMMDLHDLTPHTFNSGNVLPGSITEYGGADVFYARLEIGAYGTYEKAVDFVGSLINSKTFYDIERVSLRNANGEMGDKQIEVSVLMSLYYKNAENNNESAEQKDKTNEDVVQTNKNPFEEF